MDKTEHYFDLTEINGKKYKLAEVNGKLQICIENDIQKIRDEIEFLKLKNEGNSDENSRKKIKQKIELLEKNNESLQVQNLDDIIKMCRVELEKQQGLQKPQNIYKIKFKMAEITRLKAEILEKEKEIDNLHKEEKEAVEQARRKYTQQLQENEKKLKQIQQNKSNMISNLINEVNKKIEQNNEEISRLEQEKNDKIYEATKKNGKPLSDVQSQYIENAYKTKQDKIEQDNEKLRLLLNPANYNKYIDQKIDAEKRKIEQTNEEIKKRLEIGWLENFFEEKYTQKRDILHSEVEYCKERIENYRTDINQMINNLSKSNDAIIEQLMRLAITAKDMKKSKMNLIEKNSLIEYEKSQKKLIKLLYEEKYYDYVSSKRNLTKQEQKKYDSINNQIEKIKKRAAKYSTKHDVCSMYSEDFIDILIRRYAIKELEELATTIDLRDFADEHKKQIEYRKIQSELIKQNENAATDEELVDTSLEAVIKKQNKRNSIFKKIKSSKFATVFLSTKIAQKIKTGKIKIKRFQKSISPTELAKELEEAKERRW